MSDRPIMRPFFSYYGARWQASAAYSPPTTHIVIEPFAGSAGYSTRYGVDRAILRDINPDIIEIWRWLITADAADVLDLPGRIEAIEDLRHLPRGARNLILMWVNKGRAEIPTTISSWYLRYRDSGDCKVWGEPVKARIVRQLDRIRNWSADVGDYRETPRCEGAHYHIDPPFNTPSGRRYKYSDIDYEELAAWCRSLPGYVQVCESSNSTWLPFRPVGVTETLRGKRESAVFSEGVWTNDMEASR